jgi:tRNA-dihydrouridine synthase
MNFWQYIRKPIYALAPMEDVTDTVFREIVMSISDDNHLNMLFAEFTSVDGLFHPIGKDKVSHRLKINPSEMELMKKKGVKIVAQIWGNDPEKFAYAAKHITENYDYDGIDINMGCPIRKIVHQVACSELIRFPDLAREIIQATKEATHLPVSVKTRTGIKEHQTEKWISNVLQAKPDAITLHCRTQKMLSEKPAEWEQIRIAIDVRNSLSQTTPLIGNGDIFTIDDAQMKIDEYKPDGVMIGRGIFRNAWIFNSPQKVVAKQERLQTLINHTELFRKTWENQKSHSILKKFYKIYISEFPGSAELRSKLMAAPTLDEVLSIANSELNSIEI